MSTKKTNWAVSDITNAKNLGIFECENGEYFTILSISDRLVFGGWTNTGFIESGYILTENFSDLQETLEELLADLETFYRDGVQYTKNIVCNERM
jgi:hypothetical protein